MSMTTTFEVEGGPTVTIRVGVAGQGAVREVAVTPDANNKVTVRDILAVNNTQLGEGQTVSVNGTVVGLDHELDLGALDASAVPVVLVAPRVSNG